MMEDHLKRMITASEIAKTVIFGEIVESESPTEAELITSPIAKEFPDRIADIVKGSFVLVAGIICLWEIMNTQENVIISSSDNLTEHFPDIPVWR